MDMRTPLDGGTVAAGGYRRSERRVGDHQSAIQLANSSSLHFFRGRVALYALLRAMGIGRNDEVLLQAFTCMAVPNPILWTGATPVYVDIGPTTYNMDLSQVESRTTDRTKAIVVQHTFGIPADMDRVMAIARRHDLYVIEDSCHTLASGYRGRTVGTFGDAAFYSFEWGKPLVIGLGGVAVVNNDRLRKDMESVYHEFRHPKRKEVALIHLQYLLYSAFLTPTTFWLVRDLFRAFSRLGLMVGTFRDSESQGVRTEDATKKMSAFHRSILSVKLRSLAPSVRHRLRLAAEYDRILRDVGMPVVTTPEETDAVLLRYPVQVGAKRRLLEEARRRRVELGDWFLTPVHPLGGDELQAVGYRRGVCPEAEKVCDRIVTLPMHDRVDLRFTEKVHDLLVTLKSRGDLR